MAAAGHVVLRRSRMNLRALSNDPDPPSRPERSSFMLAAHDVTVGYGGRSVLLSVSVAVQSGAFVGLIGPNGSGKSTLLRVLSGSLRPGRGTVELNGRDIGKIPAMERARQIGFVPQFEAAAFDFTVHDVVMMGRHPYRARFEGPTAEDYRRVKRALAQADLLHLEDRPVTRLSGGEHRRVLLARALAQSTPLLLLDEPTAHLDIMHQTELLNLVRRSTRADDAPIGAIAALHDLNQAAEFCDRLVLMSAGRVEADGPPERVLDANYLRRAYNACAQIGRNPATGRPMVLTVEAGLEARASDLPRVHVICGGGSGVGILGALTRRGFKVTTGVLNRLDSDQAAAEALGVEAALEAPYSPFGSDACAKARNLIDLADVVLVAPVPFGHGNLPNLQMAALAQAAGKQVALIGTESFAERDFVGGAARDLLAQMRSRGAQCYDRLEEWTSLFPIKENP